MKVPTQMASQPVVEAPTIAESFVAPVEAVETVATIKAAPPEESVIAESSARQTAHLESAGDLMPTDVFESVFEEAAPAIASALAKIETPSLPSTPEPKSEPSEAIAAEQPAPRATQHVPNHVSATLAEMDGPHLTPRL